MYSSSEQIIQVNTARDCCTSSSLIPEKIRKYTHTFSCPFIVLQNTSSSQNDYYYTLNSLQNLIMHVNRTLTSFRMLSKLIPTKASLSLLKKKMYIWTQNLMAYYLEAITKEAKVKVFLEKKTYKYTIDQRLLNNGW